MNERIQELMNQAMESTGVEGLGGSYVELNPEKFAELIASDCANICEINGQSYKHSFTPAKARLAESTSKHCSELIRTIYGLKK